MQAIILAAGMGRRLGEYTKNDTKCMVPVNGIRLIDRVLTQLSMFPLKRIVIVVGFKGENLRKHLETNYRGGISLEFIENPIYDKTNNIYSLSLAKTVLQEDDTLLIESDLIFSDRLFKMILEHPYPNLALVAKYEKWMDGTMVCIDAENNITNFIPKSAFRYSSIDTYYKTVNIYKFSKDFSRKKYIPFLDAYSQALGNNEYYEQVLRVITMIDHSELKALPVHEEKWYEIDDVQDLDIAETLFAEGNSALRKYSQRYGGYWRFPKLLDFCYLVNPFFPTQQMKEELQSSFEELLTEYPSGMGVNSLLAGKYFGITSSYVIVGNGAAELIKALMEELGGALGVVYPTFEEYPNRRTNEDIIAYVPENDDFHYSIGDLKSFYSDKSISSLLLINPDNPSGNFIPQKDVLDLAKWCEERNVFLVVDESFVDFSERTIENTLLTNDVLENNSMLIVMKSISKSYGVPGLRLGVLASSNESLISKLKSEVAIWNINSFAEYYMQIYGKYASDYRKACCLFIEERNRFYESLRKIDFLRVIPSQANYFLCEVIMKFTSTELAKNLLCNYNILIKDCSQKKGFGGRNYVRIAIRNTKDNNALIQALLEL